MLALLEKYKQNTDYSHGCPTDNEENGKNEITINSRYDVTKLTYSIQKLQQVT